MGPNANSCIKLGLLNRLCAVVPSCTDPFHILPKSLAIAGSKDFKLHVGIGAFSTEVHQSCQAADPPLQKQE